MSNFKYSYKKPFLAWYYYEDVEIEPKQFDYLMIERRYDYTWWLLGYKYYRTIEKWEETQLGEIYVQDIVKLIDWCKEYEISLNARALTFSLDIIKPCYDIYKEYLDYKEKNNDSQS